MSKRRLVYHVGQRWVSRSVRCLEGNGALILDTMYDHIRSPDLKDGIIWHAATTMESISEW